MCLDSGSTEYIVIFGFSLNSDQVAAVLTKSTPINTSRNAISVHVFSSKFTKIKLICWHNMHEICI